MTLRYAIKRITLGAIAVATVPVGQAQTTHWEWRALAQGKIPFVLPVLPYASDALEPNIGAITLKTHHDERHAAYVKAFNKAIGEVGDLYLEWKYKDYFRDENGEAVVGHLSSLPNSVTSQGRCQVISPELRNTIREAAGGHYNHSLFWQMMKKDGGGEPTGEFAAALKKRFGSFTAFKMQFTKLAVEHPGDGWAWLAFDADALKIEVLPNEDNPFRMGRSVLLGLDLWKHAYSPQYKTRPDYIQAWFNVVNWDYVAERYSKLKPKP